MDAAVAQQSKEERADSEQEGGLPQDDAQLPREAEAEAEAEGFNLIDKALYNFNRREKIPLDFKKDLQYYTIMRERADYGRVYTPIVATFILGILGAVQLILENVEGEDLDRDNAFNSSQIIVSCAAAFITAVCSNVVRDASQKVINYVRLGVEGNRRAARCREPIARVDNRSFFRDDEGNDEKTVEKITARLFNRI